MRKGKRKERNNYYCKAESFQECHGNICSLVLSFNDSKICAKWILIMLTPNEGAKYGCFRNFSSWKRTTILQCWSELSNSHFSIKRAKKLLWEVSIYDLNQKVECKDWQRLYKLDLKFCNLCAIFNLKFWWWVLKPRILDFEVTIKRLNLFYLNKNGYHFLKDLCISINFFCT